MADLLPSDPPRRVLVVEDDPVFANVVITWLRLEADELDVSRSTLWRRRNGK